MIDENKNLDENQEKTGRERSLANLRPIPFTKDNQPSPEAKRRGWDWKKRGHQVMGLLRDIQDMSVGEYLAYRKDIIDNPGGHTMLEQWAVGYVERMGKSDKIATDWLDRIVPPAPKGLDVTSQGEKIEGVQVTFVDGIDEDSDGGDEGPQEDNTISEAL